MKSIPFIGTRREVAIAAMDIVRLEEFALLARELNFGRASDRSCVSRTAFSRHIREVEEFFGVEVVIRSRPIRLTRSGELLARYLESAAANFEDLKVAMQKVAHEDGT